MEALLAVRLTGWGVGDPQPQRHAVPVVPHEQPPARVPANAEVQRLGATGALVCTGEHESASGGLQQDRGVGEVVVPGGLQDVKLTGSG